MSAVANVVRRNFHRDSVQLLHLSEEAKKFASVKDVAIVMGTMTNREILAKLNLLTEEGRAATENDMIIALMVESQSQMGKTLEKVESLLLEAPRDRGQRYFSFDSALQALPDANLALVSVPGVYAKEIAMRALKRGLNVHLFSDHVPPEDELEIKKCAKQKGLLVMGSGAGTALISGKAVGFANVVKKGKTGIVAAAGTGLQEMSVLLSEARVGISAGLGTGGEDVKSTIGGLMMIQSIDTLEQDPETDTVVVISKPPDPDVRERILDHIAQKTKKRYVTCFLGTEDYYLPATTRDRTVRTKTLHGAFLAASPQELGQRRDLSLNGLISAANQLAVGMSADQKFVRGLYTGGTLAYEALVILSRLIGDVYSNAPLDPKLKLANSYQSLRDSIIDLGEEEFTSGRAHPMIDPTLRKIRLVEEAKDPEVAVIILDVMLGYGSHPDPAGALLPAIAEARRIAEADRRTLLFLARVCGTNQDPQPLSEQVNKLANARVHVFPTNAMMTIAAALIAYRNKIPDDSLRDGWKDLLGVF